MRFFYTLLLLFFSECTSALNAWTPESTIKRNEIAATQANVLPAADLVITEISFVSLYFDVTSKTYLVKVVAVIRNNGKFASGKTQLEAQTKPSEGSGSWKVMGNNVNIPAISSGSNYKSEFSFKGSILLVGTATFDFRLKVDPRTVVAESDETNNFSKSIVINPRAY